MPTISQLAGILDRSFDGADLDAATEIRGNLHLDDRVVLLAGPVRERVGPYLSYRSASWQTSVNADLFIHVCSWKTARRSRARPPSEHPGPAASSITATGGSPAAAAARKPSSPAGEGAELSCAAGDRARSERVQRPRPVDAGLSSGRVRLHDADELGALVAAENQGEAVTAGAEEAELGEAALRGDRAVRRASAVRVHRDAAAIAVAGLRACSIAVSPHSGQASCQKRDTVRRLHPRGAVDNLVLANHRFPSRASGG
jgi:hypothetical protein